MTSFFLCMALKRRRSERSAPVHQRDFTEDQGYCIRDYHAERARRQRRSNAEEGGDILSVLLVRTWRYAALLSVLS